MSRLSQSVHPPSAAFAALTLFAISCGPLSESRRSHNDESQTTASQPVSQSYAAFEEAPAVGGELRLETPIEIDVEVEVAVGGELGAVDSDTPVVPRRARAIGFPLKHTDVSLEVSGNIALYSVTQRFENPFDVPLEAVYVFPLGDKAAVVAYEIVIGDRHIEGVVETRQRARQIYDEAKSAGHTAALLEQEKPNIFTQHVANIAPKEEILVRFKYIELLKYRDSSYEIAYPMVVGPRYLPVENRGANPIGSHHAGAAPTPNSRSIPYVASDVPGDRISFRATIDAGVPVVSTTSPSHSVRVSKTSKTRLDLVLDEGDSIPNRDLVIRYSAASRQTMVGAMTHRGDGEDGFFTLVISPKAEYVTNDIRPRELIVLIDRSGSMSGAPLAQAKALAGAVIDTLGDRDVFNVIAFASGTDALSTQPIPGDRNGKAQGRAWVEAMSTGGGTEMERGVLSSLATVPGNDRLRMIYILSDGYVGNDDAIIGATQKYLGHNRIYPVGGGSAPNRYLFERLAKVGRGFSSYLLPADDASKLATSLVRRSSHPYLTNLEIDWSGLDVRDITPKRLPDVHAGIPLTVSGRYTKPGQATIRLKAIGGASRKIEIPLAVGFPAHESRPAVRYLWARNRVEELMNRNSAVVDETDKGAITKIGLDFQMVTAFTSFVAVDRERVVEGGASKTVVQPVRVPAGVGNQAIAGPAPGEGSSSSGSSGGGSWGGGGGGGGGWGGGDVDPFTLLYLLLLLPSIIALRRLRTE